MGGIFRYRKRQAKLLTEAKEGYTGAMYYDTKSRQLFVGRNDKDLRCYHFSGDTLIPVYDRLPGHSVLCIFPEGDNPKKILWIGTDNGLVKYDPTVKKVLKIFKTGDGLPDHVIYSVIKDDQNGLWMSTNKGLARMNSKEEFQRIKQSEGIEFNSFASLKAKDGRLYFGSVQGLFHISPASLSRPSSRGLRLSGLWVNDTSYHQVVNHRDKDLIELQYNENNLSFELASLDYFASVAPVFEYRRVEPEVRSGWVSNGSAPLVRFQNLPPDAYHFEFRALDANGFYTTPQRIMITINPPYWRRWWFVALICAVATALIYWITKIYIRKQQLIQQKLTGRVIAAQESERLRIAMDIHDDVNNTLAAAKGYLQNIVENNNEPWSQSAENSRDLIQKATEDLRNITHDLMPVKFEQYSLPDVVERRVQEWNEESGIYFTYIFAGKEVKLRSESELMIYRIITEIVNNIKKHSKATQSIVQLIYQEKSLMVSIEDNGVGLDHSIKSENKTGGIGLKNIYSRSEYLHADFHINSDKSGVLVHLIIPYVNNNTDSGSSR